MKNIIISAVLVLITITNSEAQIKKTKISVRQNAVQKDKITQGLKINKLSNLNSLGDFSKLKIPIQQNTKELLNKKPTRTWSINPRKINDGSLKLIQFNGVTKQSSWTYGGSYDENLDRVLESFNSGRIRHRGQSHIWPIQVQFRVSGGIEYRVKLKDLVLPETINNKYIYVTRRHKSGWYISRINMNESGEFNYIFKEPNSGDIELHFTAIPELRESHASSSRVNSNVWNWVSISEIQIDRID
ncbi:hypothetical protein [Polaribacter sp.]|uniref:hypothetical protein n=1 Tax=Polaribacter sp. TaxID=1920175 RepID=UPI003EF32EED